LNGLKAIGILILVMKSKLILTASIITGLVIMFALEFLLQSIGFTIWSHRYQGSLGWPSGIFAILMAIKLNWYLKGYEPPHKYDIGWLYTLYGFIIWYPLMFLGSRLYIRPPLVNELLGIVLTLIFISVFYLAYYKPEVKRFDAGKLASTLEELDSKFENPNLDDLEANLSYKTKTKEEDEQGFYSKSYFEEEWGASVDDTLVDTPLFKWNDVTHYYFYDENQSFPRTTGIAVFVTTSDGQIKGYIVKDDSQPGEWIPHPASKIKLNGTEEGRDTFIDESIDKILPHPPSCSLFSWEDQLMTTFYHLEGQPAIIIEDWGNNSEANDDRGFYIPKNSTSKKWKSISPERIKESDWDSIEISLGRISRAMFLNIFKTKLKLSGD